MTAEVIDYKTGKVIPAKEDRCSWCNKPKSATSHMWNGSNGKFICASCVVRFKELMENNK